MILLAASQFSRWAHMTWEQGVGNNPQIMQHLEAEFERVLCGNAVRNPTNPKNVARSSRIRVNYRKDETVSMPSRVLWLVVLSKAH